jgi:hypothetical protein
VSQLPDSLKLRVLAAAHQIPVAPRADQRLVVALKTTVAGALMLLALGAAGGPSHAAGRSLLAGASILAGVLALALGSTFLALPPRRSMLPAARVRLLAVALGVPLAVGAWLVLWHAAYADPFVRVGWRCFALTAASAPGPFWVLFSLSPRSDPRHPALTGASLGAAAGAWAALMVELWCPLAEPAHVAVGHVAPLVVLAVFGAAIGASVFRMRPVRSSF